MKLLLLLIPISAFAKSSPVVFPIANNGKEEVYVSYTDLMQLKLIGLGFIIYALWQIIMWLIGIISGSEKKTREGIDKRLSKLEDNDAEILDKLKELSIHFSHVKDSQVKADEIRAIARDEIEYVEKLQSKRK